MKRKHLQGTNIGADSSASPEGDMSSKSSDVWGTVAVIGVSLLAVAGYVAVESELDRLDPGRAKARDQYQQRKANLRRAEELEARADFEARRLFVDWSSVDRMRREARELRYRS